MNTHPAHPLTNALGLDIAAALLGTLKAEASPATTTKLASALTRESAQAMLATHEGRIHAAPHPLGVEVRDLRPLVERITKPIAGRGVIRHFGNTHFILTPAYAAKMGAGIPS